MNDPQRENLVGIGQAAAAYAIFKSDRSMSDKVIDNAVAQGFIDGAHTRYVVTERTGDARLGNLTGASAGLRTGGMWLGVYAGPVILFSLVVIIAMAVGMTSADNDAWPILCSFVLVPACIIFMCWMLRKTRHTAQRNAYTRNVMPSTWELNRTGYWQVEPDTWFNPITQQVLYGHAYDKREADQGRAAYRNESQQIRDLYKQMKQPQGGGQQALPPPTAQRGGPPGWWG